MPAKSASIYASMRLIRRKYNTIQAPCLRVRIKIQPSQSNRKNATELKMFATHFVWFIAGTKTCARHCAYKLTHVRARIVRKLLSYSEPSKRNIFKLSYHTYIYDRQSAWKPNTAEKNAEYQIYTNEFSLSRIENGILRHIEISVVGGTWKKAAKL